MIKWFLCGLLAAALVVVNLLGRDPPLIVPTTLGPNDIVAFSHGWPFEFLSRAYHEEDAGPANWESQISRWPIGIPPIRSFALLSLAINIFVCVLILACTFVVANDYKQRHPGPIQFGIRSIFVLTVFAATFVTLVTFRIVQWMDMVWLPVCAGIVCIPIAFHQVVRRLGHEPAVNWQTPAARGAFIGFFAAMPFAIVRFSFIEWSHIESLEVSLESFKFIGAFLTIAAAGGLAGVLIACCSTADLSKSVMGSGKAPG